MATEKVSATLDQDVMTEIRQVVGARQVSAFLAEAAREKLQRVRILDYLRKLDAPHGPADARARRRARERLRNVLEP